MVGFDFVFKLTYFRAMLSSYESPKNQKTSAFLMFSGGLEIQHRH